METQLHSSINSKGIRKTLVLDVDQINNRISEIDITVEYEGTPFCRLEDKSKKVNFVNLSYKEAVLLWKYLGLLLKPTITFKQKPKHE